MSKSTVSRVLNNSGVVDPKTRARILAVMEKHRYSPSRVARSLSNQDSSVIGVVIPEIDNPYFSKILRTIARITDEAGLTLTCCVTDNVGAKDLQALRTLQDSRVKGIIYVPANEFTDPTVLASVQLFVNESDIPVVLMDRRMPSLHQDGVFFDDQRASYIATRTLLAAGHPTVGLINGHVRLGVARERKRGYIQALEDAGVPVREEFIFEGDFTVQSAYQSACRMLDQPEIPSAVLTCSNYLALGFFQALTQRGLQVPGDIQLIGFDELDMLDALQIPYNHIFRSTQQMATKAMDLLLGRVEDSQKSPETIFIAPKYVLSDSLRQAALERYILTPELLCERGNGAL